MSYRFIKGEDGELYVAPVLKVNDIADGMYAKGKEEGYSEGFVAGKDEGMAEGRVAGEANGKARCAAKHFVAVITGDGSNQATFDLPFEPDRLTICSHAPEIRTMRDILAFTDIDFTAIGQLGGASAVSTGAGAGATYANGLHLYSTAFGMLNDDTDSGKATVTLGSVVVNGVEYYGHFGKGIDYIVIASKVDLAPLKTRIEKSVSNLPDTACTVRYQEARVNEAFTTKEWEDLISDKPNCTFNLV